MMSNKSLLLVLGLAAITFTQGCASKKHKAEEIKTEMEKSEPVTGGLQVGVKNEQMVVQRKALIAEELRKLQHEVYSMEDRVYGGPRYFGNPGIWGALNKCRLEFASVSNGGTGKMNYIEPMEYVIEEKDFSQIGLDEKGNLVALEEEFLKDRIERFQKYRGILQARQVNLQEKLDMCKLDVEAQRKSASQ